MLSSVVLERLMALVAFAQHIMPEPVCVPEDSPNPISADYPDLVSGNLNGTTMIVPIPLAEARQLIPSQWPILEHAYRELLPDFPQQMYPMMFTAVHDHDILFPAYNLSNPDFSRTSFEFPFVDILGDGFTSFRWAATMMILASNGMAINGSEGYGIKVIPSTFDPPCDAYKASSDGARTFSANSTDPNASRFMSLEMEDWQGKTPIPLAFIQNITNQVTSANGSLCDHYLRLFNTSLSAEPHRPVPVRGTVAGKLEPFTAQRTWANVFGWRLATAFLEPPIPGTCAEFRGT